MKQFLLFILVLSAVCTPVFMSGQLDLIRTEEMNLVTYDYGHRYILPHATRCFHNALQFHKKLFGYTLTEPVYVLIQDFGDAGNAGATAVPRNAISLGLSPFNYTFETNPAGERVFSMMNHELVHVIALDQASGSDRFFRGMFLGKVDPSPTDPVSMFYSYLTSPRRYSARWYHEGIASYLETWMSGGVGLAMGSYDEMVFRTLVLEEARIHSAQGLESEGVTTDFQGRSNSYLYGTRFMGYLAYQYGPGKLIDWVKRDHGSRAFFVSQFKNIYGKPIRRAWDEWISFENDWQMSNVTALKEHPVTEPVPVAGRSLGSVSYAHYNRDRNQVYVAINYPGQTPHLAALDVATGKLRRLTDIKGAALFYVSSVSYDPEGEVLYYTTDNDAWRDLNAYDIKSGRRKMLQKDVRTGSLAFNRADKSIWGIKHLNGFSTIVRITKEGDADTDFRPYSSWEQIYTLPYGSDIFDIDISPDGALLSAAVSDLAGNQALLFYRIADLLNHEFQADTVFNFEVSSPQSFRFTDDGRYLYGVSYYSGVSNIYRVEVDTRRIVPMSNSVTGFFRPVPLDDDRLFAFQFRSDGFHPVILPNRPVENVSTIEFLGNVAVERHPVLKAWQLPIARADELDVQTLITEEGKYQPGREMRLNYAYPIVVGYKNNIGVGYRMQFADPFGFRKLDFSMSFTPRGWYNDLLGPRGEDFETLGDDELFHGSMRFETGRFTFSASYNEAEFHDLFGPSQGSRKGLRGGIAYSRSLLWDPPDILDLRVSLGGFYGLDQSPEFQQIVTTGFNRNFFVNLTSSLSYSSIKGSLGAVDGEKGIQAMLWGSMATTAGNYYPRAIATLDYGILLPVNHMSLWFRTSAGSSFSDIFNPFTRFGFAAFGNNYIDYQATRRYRAPFSFPGVGYDAPRTIIAQRFAKGTAELMLPPVRFRKFGGFNFYANWMQLGIFSSALYTTSAGFPKSEMVNLGAQLDVRMVTFSLLPSTLSVGYANAWDLNSDNQYNEWMISLKLLH